MIEQKSQFNPKLISISGPVNGSTFNLTQVETTIGREPSNHICIPDPLLSRHHCRIVMDNEIITLNDLRSRNGLFVNGVPIKERRLAHQDVIKLGDSLLVFLRHEEDEVAAELSTAQSYGESHDFRPTLAFECVDSLYLSAEKLRAATAAAERLAENFQALLRIALEINAIRDLEALGYRLIELTGALIPAERGLLLLHGVGGENDATVSWYRRGEAPAPMILSQTLAQRVRNECVTILSHRTEAEFQTAESLRASYAQSIIMAPLSVSREVFGLLYLDTSDPGLSFTDDHSQLVAAIAGLASAALDNARHLEMAQKETLRLRDEIAGWRELIGESHAMRVVQDFIAKVAPTDSTVLIRGESGVGKELVARAIHRHSSRSKNPFIAINCAALPSELIESELFGHERGAFTGAVTQRVGKFEAAQGGTIFLDEIGELHPTFQAKLLRVLQEREFERVGGARSIKLNVRLLAATNRDLEDAIKAGVFRADLFYRLNVVSITVPPLRERRDDISLLAGYFVMKHGPQMRRRVKGVSAAARSHLRRYDWPGNVRELENAIQRAMALGTADFIQPDDLPDEVLEVEPPNTPLHISLGPAPKTEPPAGNPIMKYHEAVKEAKRQAVMRAMEQADGDYARAAKLLGLHPNNLYRLIRNLNLKAHLGTRPDSR